MRGRDALRAMLAVAELPTTPPIRRNRRDSYDSGAGTMDNEHL
ncbi:MAG TPA: hypothetical protein PLP04_13830 [Bryobacteraceae bacterium]|nr:hypothetical protein [Bryobacteraceae bacterium]